MIKWTDKEDGEKLRIVVSLSLVYIPPCDIFINFGQICDGPWELFSDKVDAIKTKLDKIHCPTKIVAISWQDWRNTHYGDASIKIPLRDNAHVLGGASMMVGNIKIINCTMNGEYKKLMEFAHIVIVPGWTDEIAADIIYYSPNIVLVSAGNDENSRFCNTLILCKTSIIDILLHQSGRIYSPRE